MDDKGHIINIKKPDPSKFSNIEQAKQIIETGVREDLTKVVKSETLATLAKMKLEKKKTQKKVEADDDDQIENAD